MKKQSIATLAALCVMLLLVISMAGCSGSDGTVGTSAPKAGTVNGTVTTSVGAAAIAGVTVTMSPTVTGGSATTAADGTYTMNVPGGVYTVTFAKTNYTNGTATVSVINGVTSVVNGAMATATSGKPTVTLTASSNNVGYGVDFTVAANATSPLGLPVTYTWTGLKTASTTSTGTATSVTLTAAMAGVAAPASDPGGYTTPFDIARRLQIMPVNPDTRGAKAVKVTVDDGQGGSTAVTVTVNSAASNAAVGQVPVGRITYMANANPNSTGTNTWSLTNPDGTAGTITLVSGTNRYAYFTPTVEGKYTVNVVSATTNSSIPVFAGTFQGAIAGGGVVSKTMTGDLANNAMWYDTATYGSAPTFTNWPTITQASACGSCHDGVTAVNTWTPYGATVHATFFARGINAINTNSGSCLTCHVTGYDGVVGTDKGFDDMQALPANSTWVYAKGGNAWTQLTATYPQLAALAGITCESCHGPNSAASGLNNAHKSSGTGLTTYGTSSTAYRVSYSADVCGSCHASGTGHHVFSEWGNLNPDTSYKGHGKKSVGVSRYTCACHNAAAFVTQLAALNAGNSLYTVNTASVIWSQADGEPVTCQACHDPHDTTNPNQLRVYDGYTTPNWGGFTVDGYGKGAICTLCHTTRVPTKCINDDIVSTLTNSGVCNSIGGAVAYDQTSNGSYLREDNSGNPELYTTGHDASQADILAGRSAYFMGNSLPMLSKHASVEDTCVGCHMVVNPQTHLSHGAPAVSGHVFYIKKADRAKVCANCHSSIVDGEALEVQVEDLMADLTKAMAANFKVKVDALAAGGETKLYFVSNWARATDSTSTYIRQVVTTVTTTYSSAGSTSMNIYSAKTLSSGNGTSAALTGQAGSGVAFAFGSLMTSTTGLPDAWIPLVPPSDDLVKAAWNYKLLSIDESGGVHNPTFILDVLKNTIAAM
jgi:hypothetical protein